MLIYAHKVLMEVLVELRRGRSYWGGIFPSVPSLSQSHSSHRPASSATERAMTAQPYTKADLEQGERTVRELHGLKGYDAWAGHIAKALAGARQAPETVWEKTPGDALTDDEAATIGKTLREKTSSTGPCPGLDLALRQPDRARDGP